MVHPGPPCRFPYNDSLDASWLSVYDICHAKPWSVDGELYFKDSSMFCHVTRTAGTGGGGECSLGVQG